MRRSHGRGCRRWDCEKEGGEGTGSGGGQRREEGNPGHTVPGLTGAQVRAPQGMWHRGGPQGSTPVPSGPLRPLGADRILPTLSWAGALGGWARQHPALPMPHPKPTHIPQFLARAPAPANQARGQPMCQPPVARGLRGTELA